MTNAFPQSKKTQNIKIDRKTPAVKKKRIPKEKSEKEWKKLFSSSTDIFSHIIRRLTAVKILKAFKERLIFCARRLVFRRG